MTKYVLCFTAFVLAFACGEGSDSTSGKRMSFDVTLAASPESKQFTTAAGWNVTLTSASITTGPISLFDGETLFAARGFRFFKQAHAHPGHYVAGNAKGELLGGGSVDMLVGGVLGQGTGVTGLIRSATFTFGAGRAIVIDGSATKDALTKSFHYEVEQGELLDASNQPQIVGCPFTPVTTEGNGTVAIAIKIPLWLDHVAFDNDALARDQVVRGVKGALAYTFSWSSK